ALPRPEKSGQGCFFVPKGSVVLTPDMVASLRAALASISREIILPPPIIIQTMPILPPVVNEPPVQKKASIEQPSQEDLRTILTEIRSISARLETVEK